MNAPRVSSKLRVLDDEGHRQKVYPADVKGRFQNLRNVIHLVLIVVYLTVPFLSWGGHPLVWFDIGQRRAYLLGQTFNAQDFFLVFFILSAIGFSLIAISSLFGRLWCGYACPHSVFLDFVFRRLERWVEGPASKRKKSDRKKWTLQKGARKIILHLLYLFCSAVIAHIFLAYFISSKALIQMFVEGPGAHLTTFLWGLSLTGILYFNFFWFREQMCLIVCPYGRLQSALQDDDTLLVGYDVARGEPRGKAKDPDAGDCVDCGRCLAVCPTAIDIREGLQMECIGCAACIDACDEIMVKIGRPKGLIRYDSLNGLEGKPKRFLRPRLFFYVFMGIVGVAVFWSFAMGRATFEINVIRQGAVPFVVEGERVRNPFQLHLVNKAPKDAEFTLVGEATGDSEIIVSQPKLVLEPFADVTVPVFTVHTRGKKQPLYQVKVRSSEESVERDVELKVLGP